MIERRRFQRLMIPLQIRYRIAQNRLWQETQCHDVSGRGVRLRIEEALGPGEEIELSLHFPQDPQPIPVLGCVVWRLTGEGGAAYRTGIEYLQIKPSEKERFVMRFCETMVEYMTRGSSS